MTVKETEVAASFRAELQALLDKYNATLEAKDHYQGYPECGEDIRMIVDIPAIYDEGGEMVREDTEVDLGHYMMSERKGV